MTVLRVPDMHCEHCVERITKALGNAGLVFSVSLEQKSVTVHGGKAEADKAVSELDDLGFGTTV